VPCSGRFIRGWQSLFDQGFDGFDGFVTSAAAPIATGWSDQLPGGNRTR
jgi:hypothetical protein